MKSFHCTKPTRHTKYNYNTIDKNIKAYKIIFKRAFGDAQSSPIILNASNVNTCIPAIINIKTYLLQFKSQHKHIKNRFSKNTIFSQ